MRAMLDREQLTGGEGTFDPDHARRDRLSAPGHDLDYQLTPVGHAFLADLGVALPARRRTVRYCIDWSEQAHHLAGALGSGLLNRLTGLAWIQRSPDTRAVTITAAGRTGLADTCGIGLDE